MLKCEVCSKVFKTAQGLGRHLLVHQGGPESSTEYDTGRIPKRDTRLGAGPDTYQLLQDDQDLVELRRKKEKVKLEKDIADLEAVKEKLPERVKALEGEGLAKRVRVLEAEVVALRALIRRVGDQVVYVGLLHAGSRFDPGQAKEFAHGFVERVVERGEEYECCQPVYTVER